MIDWFLRFEHGQKFALELVSASNELANSIIGELSQWSVGADSSAPCIYSPNAPYELYNELLTNSQIGQ